MQKGGKTIMAYSPYLSGKYSSTLRRIAWGLNKPMTRTLQIVIKEYTRSIDKAQICKSCRDKTKCNEYI